ncbi:MAG TPA: RagB/SusD family nutrient uptake outer membrane protein [Parapedobacter sp.]|nr:RagB/SusD family nutrient uptake outer membrane protein [Parapedobacter sp.]
MRTKYKFLLVTFLPLLVSCEKFLDQKPDQKLTIPTTLEDLEAMTNDLIFWGGIDAAAISSDDYTISDANYDGVSSDSHRRMYTWEPYDIFDEGSTSSPWYRTYNAIYLANSVEETIIKIGRNAANASKYDNVRGRALFFRGSKLFRASLVWCEAYDVDQSASQLGMPIKLDTDFNKRSFRSTLQQTYDQITKDLEAAVKLLPRTAASLYNPSQLAAYAELARVYLYMGNYEKSYAYADTLLGLKSDLMDHAEIDNTPTYPLPSLNEEVIYVLSIGTPQILNLTRSLVATDLVDSYEAGDLRKILYFSANTDGSHGFRGGRYQGGSSLFIGLATDETYLIRAESALRTGRKQQAIQDINTLLASRWEKVDGISAYKPIVDMVDSDLLAKILLERRKSLLYRGVRWYDLKRLNRDGANITLRRTVKGKEYVLPPNDPRYAIAIPGDIVKMSEVEQNPR